MTYTINAPGTTNNPWTLPGGSVAIVGSLKTDATGIRNATYPFSVVAENATYPGIVDAQVTISAETSSDYIMVGAAVKTGANAGCVVGARLNSSGLVEIGRYTAAGVFTQVGSNVTVPAFTANDVLRVTYNPSGGAVTVYYNGSSVGSGTDTTYSAEASLAAGFAFDWGNVNGTYISQFVGVGAAAGTSAKLLTMISNQAGF